ncbi:uncharacterized protein LOC62_01G001282 [Vanrija pseudolonga]|uniref:Uncharacterized protein n=1 Tax=Vanrija pseudolonga TaxID=143232 RepID=A0AAF0Y0G5_9TREE|nr:hypothetical protein LOC62_01G001282 [Vanrija pseudolonga]
MSMYNERYDDALSKAAWVSKRAGGRTYLFKYAPHPDRPGYLFVATDLETVHFEALTAPSVPTRLGQIAARDGDGEDVASLPFDEAQRRTDESLAALADAFDAGLPGASVEAEADDYFDAVFTLRSGSLSWLFNMTSELRGRQPLAFVSKHLLRPLSDLLSQDRGVEPSGDTPADVVGSVVADSGVARALRRITGAPPPASSRVTPAPRASPAPKPAPPRTKSPEDRTPKQPPSPPRGSTTAAAPPKLPPSSPTPIARRTPYTYGTGLHPSSSVASPTQLNVPTSPSGVPAPGLRSSTPPAPPALADLASSPPPPSSPPLFPSSSAPEGTDLPTSTQDPLLNTLPSKKKGKKKRAKEEEAEEEAAADKRREEMKRKMAAGGGARLGRRRV